MGISPKKRLTEKQEILNTSLLFLFITSHKLKPGFRFTKWLLKFCADKIMRKFIFWDRAKQIFYIEDLCLSLTKAEWNRWKPLFHALNRGKGKREPKEKTCSNQGKRLVREEGQNEKDTALKERQIHAVILRKLKNGGRTKQRRLWKSDKI